MLLDSRLRSWVKLAVVALAIVGVVMAINVVRSRREKHRLMQTVEAQRRELQQARVQLQEARHLLSRAENKLGFLSRHKTPVQVTAYTGQGSFANGEKTDGAYAVPHHVLPRDRVMRVALSPTARRRLNARFKDYIALLDAQGRTARLAQFVDTTAAREERPVVDIYFADAQEAVIFGRQRYLAVNISAEGSPFAAP